MAGDDVEQHLPAYLMRVPPTIVIIVFSFSVLDVLHKPEIHWRVYRGIELLLILCFSLTA